MFNVIPAIDLLDGEVVRLTQGNYSEVTHYDHSPVTLAKQFADMGASRLHVVDLNGAKQGERVNHALIAQICAATEMDVEVGGGIRNRESIQHYINAGVDQLIIGSLFVSDFATAAELCTEFPNQIIAGLDAKNDFVATEGWEQNSSLTLLDLSHKLNQLKLHSIIYTDIAKDGMMLGPSLERIATLSGHSKHPIIASGGVRHAADVEALMQTPNVAGCIVGKAILGNPAHLKSLIHVAA